MITTNRLLASQANRWKKRGLAMVPSKFGIFWAGSPYNVYMTIYHADGTIAIEHGGIEMGQGINTKVRSSEFVVTLVVWSLILVFLYLYVIVVVVVGVIIIIIIIIIITIIIIIVVVVIMMMMMIIIIIIIIIIITTTTIIIIIVIIIAAVVIIFIIIFFCFVFLVYFHCTELGSTENRGLGFVLY